MKNTIKIHLLKYGGWYAIALMASFLAGVLLLLMGCQCPKCDEPEFKPLPPEKLYDLLYEDKSRNIAYKSITIKEIIGEKDFN